MCSPALYSSCCVNEETLFLGLFRESNLCCMFIEQTEMRKSMVEPLPPTFAQSCSWCLFVAIQLKGKLNLSSVQLNVCFM